jgi:hypothetical protein
MRTNGKPPVFSGFRDWQSGTGNTRNVQRLGLIIDFEAQRGVKT